MSVANRCYDELTSAGVDVLMDDRKARPGFKFKDADLIGIPLRLVIGGKGLQEGQVELKWRWADGPDKVPVDSAVSEVLSQLDARRKVEAENVPQ
jgi:prolyl-tRNA synthetase